jgi:hypothetical protein
MHVGIDFTAGVWQGAGIGRYTRELIGAVLAQGAWHLRFTLFYAAGFPGSPLRRRTSPEAASALRLPSAYRAPFPSRCRRVA